MKLSLACIAGNAEKYISRFLDSFQPHFDEVVIIQACGNQEPDRTLEIAEKRGCVVGRYRNAEGNDWPHVDDFAAARNQAFEAATGDFVMWADLDDTLEGGEHLREELAALPEQAQCLALQYDVRDDQLVIWRERVIRKGAAWWVNPVHEELNFGGRVAASKSSRVRVIHQPIGKRSGNDERNVRILESIAEPTGSQRFHLILALRAVGRIEDAQNMAAQTVMDPPADMGKAELFELFLLMAQLQDDVGIRSRLIEQALSVDSTRREAYGELALCQLAQANPTNAEGLARAMLALPMPLDPPWNLRRKFYGYCGPQILGMALRGQGRHEEANAVETNHIIRHGAKISLLHATRGRPAMAAATRRKWLETAANPDAIEHIFAIDIDDEDSMRLALHRNIVVTGDGGPVAAWNAAAAESCGEVLLQLSDDWEPPIHWDAMILDAIGDTSKPAVLAINDGHRTDDLLCMAILTRARYKQQGTLFHPEFFSMFSDNWFSELAWKDGVVIDARDRITFEHVHPAFGKAPTDAIYERSNAGHHYAFGHGAFKRLQAGTKVAADMQGWFDFRQCYDVAAMAIPEGGEFVEVGVWKGKSLSYLGQRLQDLGKHASLYGVDTFEGDADTGAEDTEAECRANLEAAGVIAAIHRMSSTEAAETFADGSLDGVFLDGAHDYDSVSADIAAWRGKVKSGGFFAGHDIDAPGVRKALAESGLEIHRIGRCWIQKP